MTRLQKKCLIAAAGTHLLVVVVVLCSGFVTSKPKEDNTQLLDVIPANVIDAALNSGAKNAQLPPPTPMVKPVDPTPTPPVPEPPKIIEPVKPPEPKTPEKPQPEEIKPVVKPEIEIPKPPKKHEIKVDLTKVTLDQKKVVDDTKAAEAAAAAKAKREAQKKAEAFRTAMRNISTKASSATEVEMIGTSSVSYANYASVVKSVYDRAWTPPDDMVSDEVNTKVSVVISRDGTVVSSRILERSGEAKVDASVQRTLDRVDFVAPFPEGATEKERTFIINFNPQARKSSG